MRLSSGTRFGTYEILAPLGAGGMGEVYRARDTRLKRDVAIKVLQGAWVDTGDRLARFEREAELLAALNHPNIAAIYGIEESAGTTALVLELVEGPTLADRLVDGPLALSDAIAISRQIIDALDAAHEKGIVHRDLKPANIKVRQDGTVKVLDFGLAKALESDVSPQGVTMSPTMTSPAVTSMGVVLGTAAYMSPEQARGQFVDKRIGYLGVRMRALRDALRPERVRACNRRGYGRGDSRARARLVRVARSDTDQPAAAAAQVSGQEPQSAASRHRGRAARVG